MLRLAEGVDTNEELQAAIDSISSLEEFKESFGVVGCDLSEVGWWAVYARQSLEEQRRNNRLAEYLFTCAREAKRLGAVVPRDYILYDAVSGEHLDRPAMVQLRQQLLPQRKIAGIIFPALDRLSREPIHIGIFEFEAEYVGVRVHYADALNGSDPMSQLVRMNIASAAKFVKLANKRNNLGGNIGRVLKGLVPAGKTPYGYKYCKKVDPTDARVVAAWWEPNELDPEGRPLYGSEAWVVTQSFHWMGMESASPYWVAKKLNELGVRPRYTTAWSPSIIVNIIRRRCYTGNHSFNTGHYVVNPKRPMKDIAGEIRRTIRKPKPEEEHVRFTVPAFVSEDLWQRANSNLDERAGRRPKRQSVQVLCRHRVCCPKCGRTMSVRQDGRCPWLRYYICPGYYQGWKANRCDMRWVRADWVDGSVWRRVKRAMAQPELVLKQMERRQRASQECELSRNIRLLNYQIVQAESQIGRVQQAYENDGLLYTPDEATRRIGEYRDRILRATQRKEELESALGQVARDVESTERIEAALAKVHADSLRNATFEDKVRVLNILDVKVYPSENLDAIGVTCAVNLNGLDGQAGQVSCHNTSIASPKL